MNNQRICSLLLLLCTWCTSWAQTFGVVDKVEARHEGDSVQVYLTLNPEMLSMGPTTALSITPWLVAGSDSVQLPAIHVVGRMVYYRHKRHDDLSIVSPGDIVIWEKRRYRPFAYVKRVAFKPWMDAANLRLVLTETDACDDVTVETTADAQQPSFPRQMARPKVQTAARHETIVGRMSIIFPLDRTELHPELYNNQRELDKIRHSIDQVVNDSSNTLQSIHMKGWASPEGPYWNNVRLARGRVDTLAKYVESVYQFPKDFITTENEPEDWVGLIDSIRLADPQNLPHKAELLEIAQSNLAPDRRERLMRTRYPKDFAYLLEHCLPLLRHSDYRIDYTHTELPPRLNTAAVERTAGVMPTAFVERTPVGEVYEPHRFIFALKTNLLFDLALAPNVELELPLGHGNRWSMMAEFWSPWYVWHHNSRAYELEVWGLELRRWMGACRERVPKLVGSFAGVYAAFGRYDFEWNHIGNQGETFSVGLTYGHTWPISCHWNLELSGSIGACYGPLRHYHGEFSDTHLIWKHNGAQFYAGPTKLKFSLVWLLGNKKKGGAL